MESNRTAGTPGLCDRFKLQHRTIYQPKTPSELFQIPKFPNSSFNRCQWHHSLHIFPPVSDKVHILTDLRSNISTVTDPQLSLLGLLKLLSDIIFLQRPLKIEKHRCDIKLQLLITFIIDSFWLSSQFIFCKMSERRKKSKRFPGLMTQNHIRDFMSKSIKSSHSRSQNHNTWSDQLISSDTIKAWSKLRKWALKNKHW